VTITRIMSSRLMPWSWSVSSLMVCCLGFDSLSGPLLDFDVAVGRWRSSDISLEFEAIEL
jgi:hypothetical protein